MCAPFYNQGILILIWSHGSPQYFYWHIGYILSKKLLLGAANIIFSISELYTVESHHQILNRSFIFVIIKENW